MPLTYLSIAPLGSGEVGQHDELDGVAQGGLGSYLGQHCKRVISDLAVLLLAPDLQNLTYLALFVGVSAYDDHPVQQVEGDTVRGSVGGASDGSDTSVGGHYQHRRQLLLQGAVNPRETFQVQHVNL